MKFCTKQAAILGSVLFFMACASPEKKVEAAKDKVSVAEEELKAATEESLEKEIKALTVTQWQDFKNEKIAQLNNNDMLIGRLKVRARTIKTTIGVPYIKRLDVMEKQNDELRVSIESYKAAAIDTASFKTNFNKRMAELKASLEDTLVVKKSVAEKY